MIINFIKLIFLSLIISLVLADDCSVVQDILTQNNVEVNWSPSNTTRCCSYEGISCNGNNVIQM